MKTAKNKNTLILWGYDARTGERYVDSLLVVDVYSPEFIKTIIELNIEPTKKEIEAKSEFINMFFLRRRFQNLNYINLKNIELNRDEAEILINNLSIKKLNQLMKRS